MPDAVIKTLEYIPERDGVPESKTLEYVPERDGVVEVKPVVDNTLATQLNAVYQERDELVAYLTRLYPSYLALASDAEEGWSYIVYVETPAGQLSWHVPDREVYTLFNHLKVEKNNWDGHTTREKYDRLRMLPVLGI